MLPSRERRKRAGDALGAGEVSGGKLAVFGERACQRATHDREWRWLSRPERKGERALMRSMPVPSMMRRPAACACCRKRDGFAP